MTEIFVYIERGEKFKKRLEINWGDGAVSVINNDGIILRGRDGKTYQVAQDSEHALVCQNVLFEKGFSLS